MTIFGAALVLAGIGISVLMLLHDWQRIRVSLEAPQAAPSRLPPEAHVLAAILDAAGWICLRGWLVGGVVLVAHLVISLGLAPVLIERSASWLARR